MLRVSLSVPETPTTVVIPASMNSRRLASGQRETGPASPPPPVTWMCWSMTPGIITRPLASTVSMPGTFTVRSLPTATILSLTIKTSVVPRCSGA